MTTETAALGEFEAIALQQRVAKVPWQPVTDYSFEARTIAEGRHPQIILDTFRPSRVLDVGCGPGHLVRLLNERAGYSIAFGADITDDPDYLLDISAEHLRFGRQYADLVICREVLEHLTLLQIRRAITNLCACSSRYIYVTTRFSSEADLFRVETHDDLDPTHITLPAKDLIRLLFVLEGVRARPDLETTLDWQHKGRVLVYEHV